MEYPIKNGEINFINDNGDLVLSESFIVNEDGLVETKETIIIYKENNNDNTI